MNDRERELLKDLRGPSQQVQADAKRYVTDAAWRAEIDAADRQNGTSLGKSLRATYFGEKPEPTTPAAPTQPDPVAVAAAVTAFPRERCAALFKGTVSPNGDARHAESLSKLSVEERAQARLAARFFQILPSDGSGASVVFTYETPADRRRKREAREAAAADAARKQSEALPPGVTRNERGELGLADPVAFEAWKKEKAEHKEAVEFLESQVA